MSELEGMAFNQKHIVCALVFVHCELSCVRRRMVQNRKCYDVSFKLKNVGIVERKCKEVAAQDFNIAIDQ